MIKSILERTNDMYHGATVALLTRYRGEGTVVSAVQVGKEILLKVRHRKGSRGPKRVENFKLNEVRLMKYRKELMPPSGESVPENPKCSASHITRVVNTEHMSEEDKRNRMWRLINQAKNGNPQKYAGLLVYDSWLDSTGRLMVQGRRVR